MKVKNWLIHKIGGKTKDEILPPIQYTVYRPKVKTITAKFVDRGTSVPREYIEDMLARDLLFAIKNYMKIEEDKGDTMIKFFKRKYGYPECDFLNNAIRFLLPDSNYGKNKTAIKEICYALVSMNGYVYDDLKVQLKEKGIFNFN